MRILNRFVFNKIAVLSLLLCIFPMAGSEANKDVIFAYLVAGLTDLKSNERQIALQLLANELTRDTDLKILIKPVLTFARMQDLIEQGKIDFTIINSFHYLDNYQFFQKVITSPVWAVRRGPADFESYLVVAQKQYADIPLNFFRNKQLSTHSQYLLMNFYLEFLLYNSTRDAAQDFFNKIKQTKTASHVVLEVYFNASDLCIVPRHIFDLTVDLNPAILKGLAVIHQSESLFSPALTFTFEHVDESITNL